MWIKVYVFALSEEHISISCFKNVVKSMVLKLQSAK